MSKRFTEEQIFGLLQEADAGVPVKGLRRRHGCSGRVVLRPGGPGSEA
jgi:putative transposase